MHYIQKHILDKLRIAHSVRYAQLKPDEIESGHFRYHLGQLVQDGYVDQIQRGLYSLSVKGQQQVDKLSARKVVPERMPKVITYTLLIDGNSVMLQDKQKQPYMHLLNMIGGKLHENETSAQASVREVYEKTGTKIETPEAAGVFEIIVRAQDKVFSHVVAYVFTAQVKAADFDPQKVVILDKNSLADMVNLAPDLLVIYNKISHSKGICVDVIELQFVEPKNEAT